MAVTRTVLSFDEVSLRYRRHGRWVLDGVCLDLSRAELLCLQGGNGSGKSTLIRLAAGYGRATSGDIRRSFASCGFVPDRVAPLPRLTARSYLSHLSAMDGRQGGKTHRAVDLAERFGLSPGLDTPLDALSRGNLRKVVLSQALARTTDIVIMDEPLAGLDAAAVGEVVAVVAEKQIQGCAFLIATHSGAFAELGTTQQLRDGRLHDIAQRRWIDLLRPLPGRADGVQTPAGVGYWVDIDEVQSFLGAALAAECGVLSVLAPADRRGEG